MVALYHVVYAHEGFTEAANALFELVKRAQEQWPGKRRRLYLDIEGHRNSDGGFDADMLELQSEFLVGHRWWSLPEIEGSDAIFVPRRLAHFLPPILAGHVPDEPVEVGV